MARGIKSEKFLDRRGVGELDGILGMAGEFFETAEKQDLHANRLRDRRHRGIVTRNARGGAAAQASKAEIAVGGRRETGRLAGASTDAGQVGNLGVAYFADLRWTTQIKPLLRSSRIDTTRAFVGALAMMNARPGVLLSASAI